MDVCVITHIPTNHPFIRPFFFRFCAFYCFFRLSILLIFFLCYDLVFVFCVVRNMQFNETASDYDVISHDW